MKIKYYVSDICSDIIEEGNPHMVRADIYSELKMSGGDHEDDRIAELLYNTDIDKSFVLSGKEYQVHIELSSLQYKNKAEVIESIKNSWRIK